MIDNPKKLEEFLSQKDPQLSLAIKYRTVLRVFPFFSEADVVRSRSPTKLLTLLFILRILFFTSAILRFPGNSRFIVSVYKAESNLATFADLPSVRFQRVFKALRKQKISIPDMGFFKAPGLKQFINFPITSNQEIIWHQIDYDCLEENSTILLKQPLWMHSEIQDMDLNWRDLKMFFASDHENHLSIWIEWYEAQLEGREIFSEAIFTKMAELSDKDWKEGPAYINPLLAGWLEEERQQLDSPQDLDQEGNFLVPPAQEPAPLILDVDAKNQIAPRKTAVGSRLDDQKNIAALKAAKDALQNLAESARSSNDQAIRKDTLDDIGRISDRIPDHLPAPAELYPLAGDLDYLKNFAPKVESDWNDQSAARYMAATNSFDLALSQFPDYHEYIHLGQNQEVTAEQTETTINVSGQTVNIINQINNGDHVTFSPDISQNIESQVNIIQTANDESPETRKIDLYGLRQSLINLIKKTADIVYNASDYAVPLVEGARQFLQTILSAIPSESWALISSGLEAANWLITLIKAFL